MSGLSAFGRENPSFALFSAPLFKNVKDAIAHRYAPPSFFGLAVRHEDHAGFPIQVLDAHPVKLSFVPMPVSRIKMMMSRKSRRLRFRQLQAAAPANNFFSGSYPKSVMGVEAV